MKGNVKHDLLNSKAYTERKTLRGRLRLRNGERKRERARERERERDMRRVGMIVDGANKELRDLKCFRRIKQTRSARLYSLGLSTQ